MINHFVKIIASLLVIASAELYADNYRLGNVVNPVSQKISLTLNPSDKGFKGLTNISIRLNQPTTHIPIHSKNLNISKARLIRADNNKSVDLWVSEASEFDIVPLKSPRVLDKGEYQLEILYSGVYGNEGEGLYKFSEAGVDYLATQFQAMKARTVFPSFDEPGFKIPFKLSITTPKALEVLASTPVNSVVVQDKLATYTFERTAAINTDVLAFSVGKFDRVKVTGLPVESNIYVTLGKADQAAVMAAAIPQLFQRVQSYFASEFPYQKLDFLVLPQYSGAGMENVGLITLNEDMVLFSPDTAKEGLYELYKLLAHEIAHMWFGNLVTMRWWDDLWLNESFADWLARKIVLAHFPEVKGELKLPQLEAFWDDGPQNPAIKRKMKSVADYNAIGQIVYSKGHALIAMVEEFVGEDKFRQAIIDYVRKYAGENVSYQEFIAHMEKHTQMSLNGIFKSFLTQSGYPLVTLKMKGELLEISQQPFALANRSSKHEALGLSPITAWDIPLQLKFLTHNGIKNVSVLLDKAKLVMPLPKGALAVFPDGDALGYYRYQVISDKATDIKKQLILLTDKEKKSWLANTTDLARGGYQNFAEVLRLQVKLINDTTINPQIAADIGYELMDHFQGLVPPGLHKPYIKFLTKELSGLRASLNWGQQANLTQEEAKLNARLLTLFGGRLKDKEAIGFARSHYRQVLKGSSSLNVALQNAVLNLMASVSGADVFQQYKEAYLTSQDAHHKARLIRYLGYFSFSGSVKNYYDFLFSSDMPEQDFRGYYLQYPVYTPANRLAAIEYFEHSVAKLFEKVADEEKQWQPYSFASACSITLKIKLNDVFSPYVKKVEGLKDKLANVNNMIEQCIEVQQQNKSQLSSLFTL